MRVSWPSHALYLAALNVVILPSHAKTASGSQADSIKCCVEKCSRRSPGRPETPEQQLLGFMQTYFPNVFEQKRGPGSNPVLGRDTAGLYGPEDMTYYNLTAQPSPNPTPRFPDIDVLPTPGFPVGVPGVPGRSGRSDRSGRPGRPGTPSTNVPLTPPPPLDDSSTHCCCETRPHWVAPLHAQAINGNWYYIIQLPLFSMFQGQEVFECNEATAFNALNYRNSFCQRKTSQRSFMASTAPVGTLDELLMHGFSFQAFELTTFCFCTCL